MLLHTLHYKYGTEVVMKCREMDEVSISISGMTCSSCAKAVESKLQQMVGINHVNVNLLTEYATVCCQPKIIDKVQIVVAINSLGFRAHVIGDVTKAQENNDAIFCLIFAIPEFIVCMLCPYVPIVNGMLNQAIIGQLRITDVAEVALTTPIQYRIGKKCFDKSRAMLRQNVYSMDLLILIATTVAYVYSIAMIILALLNLTPTTTFFETSTTLLTFLVISKRIEQKTKKKTNKTLQNLATNRPKKARLLKDTKTLSETLVDIECIQINDLIKIMPGESVPVDGIVTNGQSKLNESLISGESKPQTKKIGDTVYAGAFNLNSPLILKSTAKVKDSFIDKMLAMIQNSQSFKTIKQLQADYVAKFFIPGILTLSLLTFSGWIIAFLFYTPPEQLGFADSLPPLFITLKFSITVLVVECPCSLTLAIPTANAVGIGIGAEKGILIKGGQVFENAARLEYVIFDKIGTLTNGRINIVKFQLTPQISNSLLISLLYLIEKESEHYSASIICTYLNKTNPNCLESMQNQIVLKRCHKEPGCGVVGTFIVNHEDCEFRAGRISWLLENSTDNYYFREHYLDIESALCSGNTVVGLSFNSSFCGFIVLNDQLKRDAECCIIELKQMHLKTAILSGDSLKTVRYISNQLGIPMYFSEISPIGKASIIRNLQMKSKIAMIGDGMNDSPALSQSDIGIVVCNGTDLVVECADVILVKNGLWRIPFLLVLAGIVQRTIFLNFLISFCYNLIMLPLASGILFSSTGLTLHPWIGAIMMTLSSMTVILSSIAMKFNPSLRKFLNYK